MAQRLPNTSVEASSVLEAVHKFPPISAGFSFQVGIHRLCFWKSIGNMAGFRST
jgi:hypothetical protein